MYELNQSEWHRRSYCHLLHACRTRVSCVQERVIVIRYDTRVNTSSSNNMTSLQQKGRIGSASHGMYRGRVGNACAAGQISVALTNQRAPFPLQRKAYRLGGNPLFCFAFGQSEEAARPNAHQPFKLASHRAAHTRHCAHTRTWISFYTCP